MIFCTIAALLSVLAACSADDSNVSPTAVKKALTTDIFVTEKEHLVKGDEQLVVVVGENHASVRTQIQLANLIIRLLDQNLVQAILVEGSSGRFDIAPFVDELASLPLSGAGLPALWHEQLETGRVAGYEYVALTQPRLEIVGVEDMGAKARYEVGAQTRAYQEVAASYERAAAVLQRDLESLRQAGNVNDIQRVNLILKEFEAARSRYAGMPDELARRMEPFNAPTAELLELPSIFNELYLRLNTLIPSYDDFEKWCSEAQVLYKRLKPVLDETGSFSTVSESDLSPSQSRDLRELNELSEKISPYKRGHQSDLDKWEKLSSRFSLLSKQLDESQKELKPFLEKVEDAKTDLQDCYFVAANALQSLAAEVGAPRPSSMAFFHEERERQNKESSSREKPFLAERDRAMAANAVGFLQKGPKQRVLLIVGYAHLPGLTEQLAADNVSFISGRLQASDEDIEPWELNAWEFRKRAYTPVFSARDRQLKEVSPLLNVFWRKEQLARLAYLRQAYEQNSGLEPIISGLVGNSRIFENVGGKDHALVIGGFPFDRNADFGSHVLDQGVVPGRPGESYRVFDRGTADRLIKELSDDIADFVYYYKTKAPTGGTATYRLRTVVGEKSLHDFMESPPSKAKCEILFGEPDEVEEAGLVVSPLQSELCGSGAPPTRGRPPWTSAYADPSDPHHPILLRTINAERARQHLIALEKQQPSRLGDVAFFEEVDLPALPEKLMFTPQRGDYAQMMVLIAHNTAEFRASIRRAADAKLLEGKQVALITCGDAFAETTLLREDLLRAGALMVWINDRQVTVEAARRLWDEAKSAAETLPAEQRRTIEQLMNHSLRNWKKADPKDPGHEAFRRAAGFVDARPCGKLSQLRC
jgi:hypothetical protein